MHFKKIFEYFLYNRCTICRLKKTETLGTKNEYFLWFKPYSHTICVVVSLLSMLYIIELKRLFNTMWRSFFDKTSINFIRQGGGAVYLCSAVGMVSVCWFADFYSKHHYEKFCMKINWLFKSFPPSKLPFPSFKVKNMLVIVISDDYKSLTFNFFYEGVWYQ